MRDAEHQRDEFWRHGGLGMGGVYPLQPTRGSGGAL